MCCGCGGKVLKDKVAIVTGASRGIGKAIAIAFGEAGAHVVLAARTVEDLVSTERLIREAGGDAITVPTDVGDFSAIEHLTEETLRHYGRIDILVNNAGISPILRKAEEWTPEVWKEVIDIDLNAVFLCSLSVGRRMIQQGDGCIINISSMSAETPIFGQIAYSVAKAGVVMLTRALAIEWAKYHVRVNSVAPGNFEIGIGERPFKRKGKYYQYLLEKTPWGRFGKAQELTGMVIFLASDAASYMTGQTVFVDGGVTAV